MDIWTDGEGKRIQEVEIIEWFIEEGAAIKKSDCVCKVQTYKVREATANRRVAHPHSAAHTALPLSLSLSLSLSLAPPLPRHTRPTLRSFI